MGKDRFTARPMNFDGKPGFMVYQVHNGKKVVEQFVAEEVYDDFCKAINVVPKIIR